MIIEIASSKIIGQPRKYEAKTTITNQGGWAEWDVSQGGY